MISELVQLLRLLLGQILATCVPRTEAKGDREGWDSAEIWRLRRRNV